MTKELAGGVDVCTKSEHHRSEGVSGGVERDILGDASLLCHLLDVEVDPGLRDNAVKHKIALALW